VSWTVDGTAFAVQVTVPPNTTAEVVLPDGGAPVVVGSGAHAFQREIIVPAPVEKPTSHWSPE
jgi:alpha-L-rhamnosidase